MRLSTMVVNEFGARRQCLLVLICGVPQLQRGQWLRDVVGQLAGNTSRGSEQMSLGPCIEVYLSWTVWQKLDEVGRKLVYPHRAQMHELSIGSRSTGRCQVSVGASPDRVVKDFLDAMINTMGTVTRKWLSRSCCDAEASATEVRVFADLAPDKCAPRNVVVTQLRCALVVSPAC